MDAPVVLAVTFVALATGSVATYWHRPALTSTASADIRPGDLNDQGTFVAPSVHSNFWTGRAIAPDGHLAIPPAPAFPREGEAANLALSGTAPRELFERSAEPLRVRVYGFAKRGPAADAGQLARVFNAWRRSPDALSPVGAILDAAGAGVDSGVRVPDSDWLATQLAEATVAGPGRFELRVPLDRSIGALAIECSRAVPAGTTGPRCIDIDRLVTPNEGDGFVAPTPLPAERRVRSAFGSLWIDARDLSPGHYQLPTFDYGFVRVRRGDGVPMSTYQYEGRTAIRHEGLTDSYTVGYELVPEILALLAAAGMLLAYAVARRLRLHRLRSFLGPGRAPEGSSRGIA